MYMQLADTLETLSNSLDDVQNVASFQQQMVTTLRNVPSTAMAAQQSNRLTRITTALEKRLMGFSETNATLQDVCDSIQTTVQECANDDDNDDVESSSLNTDMNNYLLELQMGQAPATPMKSTSLRSPTVITMNDE